MAEHKHGLHDEGSANRIEIDPSVAVTGYIKGSHNVVVIKGTKLKSEIELKISGDYNTVYVGAESAARKPAFRIGNHVPSHNVTLEIADGFSSESGCQFFLYNSGNKLIIGRDCMFSNSIIVRCGESPHLLFDKETGRYLDISDGVFVGDHVWVGERAYITKNATIPAECVVAACSVVTKRFEEESCVLAGNPARIARRGVRWDRNKAKLPKGSAKLEAWRAFNAPYPKVPQQAEEAKAAEPAEKAEQTQAPEQGQKAAE